jgi:hypothetical protein
MTVYNMSITTKAELPAPELVLYLHGEGLRKCLLYAIPDIPIMVSMPFPELLAYYEQWRNLIRVHNRWAVNGDYVRHIELNVPFHAGLIHMACNAVIPVNVSGCTRIFHFINQNNKVS